MSVDASLVIHGGELMPVGQAWVAMVKEFTQHGYSEARIKSILERAHAATQSLLRQIAVIPEAERAVRLEWALRADASAAAAWRSQWSQKYEKEQYKSPETHDARMARYRRDQELQDQELQRELLAEAEGRKKRDEEQKQLATEHRKAQWVQQCKQWEAKNDTGGWKAEAAERARMREAKDHRDWLALLLRIQNRDQNHYWVPSVQRGGTFDAMLSLLTDHAYIHWMFDSHQRGLMAPI